MRPTIVAVAFGTFFGYTVRGQVAGINEACPAVHHHKPLDAGVESLFKVTTLVRSLTPASAAHQTTAAADQRAKAPNEAVNYSLVTAAMRPFLAALNASTLGQAMYLEGGDDAKLPAPEELDDLQIQILKRTPVINQNFEPHRLSIALMLSLMMATYGWKIGSYSGMKCCVFLLFLVYFRLRGMHDTLN